MGEFSFVLDMLSKYSEGLTIIFAVIILSFGIFLKREDKELNKVAKFSELQTDQLTLLLEQNSELSKQLTLVRQELTMAYGMINDMRERVTELEETLKHKERSYYATNSGIHRSDTGI